MPKIHLTNYCCWAILVAFSKQDKKLWNVCADGIRKSFGVSFSVYLRLFSFYLKLCFSVKYQRFSLLNDAF